MIDFEDGFREQPRQRVVPESAWVRRMKTTLTFVVIAGIALRSELTTKRMVAMLVVATVVTWPGSIPDVFILGGVLFVGRALSNAVAPQGGTT